MTGAETATWISRWLRAHQHQPVRVTDLAAAMGLSVRRVQAICQAQFGQSPMGLLRGIRLDHARAVLLAAGPAPVTVAAAADTAQFTRVARFSAAYRQRFGETPAQTLRPAPRPPSAPAQPSAIEALRNRWGQAFIIFYARDRWLAMRRDDGFFLPADTLAQLEHEMTVQLTKRPLDAGAGDGRQHLAEYLGPDLATRFGLTGPPTAGGPGHDEDDADGSGGEPPGDDESFLLAAMQAAFPAWTIQYSPPLHAWIARTRKKTICENSAVLLCASLLLIERRYRQATPGPGPG